MLSLCELRRALRALEEGFAGARLERVVQPAADEIVLTLGGGGTRTARERAALLLSCRPGVARLSLLAAPRPAPPAPPGFAQYLRAHFEGGRLVEVRLRSGDRQASLRFETGEGAQELLLSILGARSNLYALDARDALVAALRPLPATRRDLALGEPWRDPPSAPPPEGEDRFTAWQGAELLAAIESHYAEREQQGDAELRCRRLRQALKKQRDGLARKEQVLRRDLASAAEAAPFERFGELLKGALREARPGAAELEVPDWESGESVRIPLDPALSARENMERYFKRHRKALKQRERAERELGDLGARAAELDALGAELEGLITREGAESAALEAFAARPPVARLLQRYFPPPPEAKPPRPKLGKRELPARLLPRRYRTRDGLEVWVGRNDEGNDLLTTRLAHGRDLFFHLEASPGSHVVLRTGGSDEPPSESLLEAAELAVHFSKQRSATRASVHVAAIKDVSKPRGTKPGLVYVHRGRTLALRRDPARLARILAARIDGGGEAG